MGKLRLKLQDIMPVWYHKLKLEIVGNHANYKRWSSQRKLSASKNLIKAFPLSTQALHKDSAKETPSQEERDSAERENQERDTLSHTHGAEREAQQRETHLHAGAHAQQKYTHGKPLLHEERETQETKPPYLAEKEAGQLAGSKTHHALSSNKVLLSPLSHSHAERECPFQEERETHFGALQTHHIHAQQAPSLSSPHALSEKSFHLNLQELEARLKALNTQERRLYYSSPIFTGASPTPVFNSNAFQGKLHIDSFDLSSVNSPFLLKDKNFSARKLFCEEVKPSIEGSRSSHGSTSFTGPSITSSEDTGFEKASSSVWERDLSSLTSEGSELFPALHDIENNLFSPRRRARRVRRDTPAKQKRRHKEASCKVLHALDDYNCIHDATFCTDMKCPCQAHGKALQSSSKRKFKISLGSGANVLQAHEALQSMEEQSECVSDAQVDEGDGFLAHKSFPYETLSLDSISRHPFSPCYYADCDKLSPIQCSDSALSDSESCWSYERRGHQQQSSFGSDRRCVFSDNANIDASLPSGDVYREILQRTGRPFNAESRLPSLSKSKSTCRIPHSSVCDCYNDLLFSKRASFDANTSHPPFPKSRGTFRRKIDASIFHDKGSCSVARSAIYNENGMLSSSSYDGTCTWRGLKDSPFDNRFFKGYPKSPSTWRTRNDITCDVQSRLQLLKSASKRSAEADYDGDESLHSYNGTVASLPKSNSRREIDGNEFSSVASLSKSPSTLRTFNDGPYDNQSKPMLLAKSASKQSTNGDYDDNERFHSHNSVLSRAKSYINREGDSNECASMSKRELAGNECNSMASMYKTEIDNNECSSVASMYKTEIDDNERSSVASMYKDGISLGSMSKKGLDYNECSNVASMSKSYMMGSKSAAFMCKSHSNGGNSVASLSKRALEGLEIHSNECNSVGVMSKSHSNGCSGVELMCKRGEDGCGCNSVESMCKSGVDAYGCNSVASMSKGSSKREGEDGKESNRGAKSYEEERGSGNKGGKGGEGKEGEGGQEGNWYKGGLRVVRGEKERKEKSKVYESFAMVKCSDNPSQDFKESMMDMILHKKLHDSMDLVELLHCFLSLNSPRYHDTIVKAFIDLWSHFYHPSP